MNKDTVLHNIPLVGIVILNFNGAEDTIECIHSLRRIDYHNTMIVVVDNNSTDNSVDVLQGQKDLLDFQLVCAESNKGFSAGNNIGITFALDKGCEYILLLNNDTVVTETFLSELMNVVIHKDAVVTGTILYYWEKNKIWYAGGNVSRLTGKTRHYHIGENKDNTPKHNEKVNFVSGCEMLISKDNYKKIGCLDEDYFLYGEDVDYSLRIAANGIEMIYVPNSIIYHKVGASTSKISKIAQYYSARNRRILIYRNFKWYEIITSLLFTHAQTIHRILHKQQSVVCVITGIIDYYRKKYGRTSRTFS